MIHPSARVSDEVNRKLLASNSLLQLLALYTDPASHYTALQMDNIMMPIDRLKWKE